MNERIQELADKIWAEEYWDNPNTDKLLPAQLNKFAKLLLNEFIDALEYSNCIRGETSDYGLSILINDIKERFDEPTRN